jgi:hypothetical protein
MTTPSTTPEYLLLLRGTQFENRLSLQEMQDAMGEFTSWLEKLGQQGKFKGGQPLAPSGKIISGKDNRSVADGPFAEAKEAIGGYLILTVPDLDTAVAIARECPLLDWGAQVEVRPVLEQCPTMQILDEHRAEAVMA